MKKFKVFVISLRKSFERKERIQSQFSNLKNIDFSFFDAIEGVGENGSKNELILKHYSVILRYFYCAKELLPGELGCFASHYCLWQKCLELDCPIVVLEDDIDILPSFCEVLEEVYRSDFVYVRLMRSNKKRDVLKIQHFELLKNYVSGSQGYYLTPKAAKQFILNASRWVEPVDDYLNRYPKHKIPTIIYEPNPICDNDYSLASTIASPRRTPYLKSYFKLCRETRKAYQGIYKFFYDKYCLP